MFARQGIGTLALATILSTTGACSAGDGDGGGRDATGTTEGSATVGTDTGANGSEEGDSASGDTESGGSDGGMEPTTGGGSTSAATASTGTGDGGTTGGPETTGGPDTGGTGGPVDPRRPSDCPGAAMHSYRISQDDFDAQELQFVSLITAGSGFAQEFEATGDADLEGLVAYVFEPTVAVECAQHFELIDVATEVSLATWDVDLPTGLTTPPTYLDASALGISLVGGRRYQLRLVGCPETSLIDLRRAGWIFNTTETYPQSELYSKEAGGEWMPLDPAALAHTSHFEVCVTD